jgi:hypothetical protein
LAPFFREELPMKAIISHSEDRGYVINASSWSVAALVFFVLTVLATLSIPGWWIIMRPAVADRLLEPAAGTVTLLGIGIAWWVALSAALCGSCCGGAGLVKHEDRTVLGWTAFILNAGFVAISVAILLMLAR